MLKKSLRQQEQITSLNKRELERAYKIILEQSIKINQVERELKEAKKKTLWTYIP